VTESVTKYDAWSIPGASNGTVRVASTNPIVPASGGMKNQTVIELAKAGLADETIMATIDAAPQTSFDLSAEGVSALTRGGVSKDVIAHMKTKTRK